MLGRNSTIGRFALASTGNTGVLLLYEAEEIITSSWNHLLYLDQGFLSMLLLLIVTYSGVNGVLRNVSNGYLSKDVASKLSSIVLINFSGTCNVNTSINEITVPTPST